MEREQEKVLVRHRRQDKFRMRRKALKIGRACMPHWTLIWQSADHLAACSCVMCGNPRKYGKGKYKLTLRERKDRVTEREFLWELMTC